MAHATAYASKYLGAADRFTQGNTDGVFSEFVSKEPGPAGTIMGS
jgi:hypothetical protein